MYSNKTYFWYWLFSFYLQVFLDHRPRDEVRQLVSARTNGATPLVLSCRNGHKDVVEYLVERCNADVEQAGTCLSLQNNCQFAMDHKNKTFKNIISWWQLSVFSTLRLLKPITVNLGTSRLLCGSFFNVIVSVWSTLAAHLRCFGRNAILRSTSSAWRHIFLKNSSLENVYFYAVSNCANCIFLIDEVSKKFFILLLKCVNDIEGEVKVDIAPIHIVLHIEVVPMHIQKSLECPLDAECKHQIREGERYCTRKQTVADAIFPF